ncbi:MAG: pyridoxamine 5'-phosphate oxidase family protein, partial [Actinomycetota bacterium]|nr:pyridoxamine 5'-phosphate oxidase family protein [Actinomycetota bacterium]
MSTEAPTPRTRVRRLPELGVYERERVHAILDEALYCHLAWVGADGDPRVIPTIHARIDDDLYVHGSAASSTLRAIKRGLPVAIAVTIVDGIRFARSMFEHSMNYRTVIVYGTAEEVTDRDELTRVFDVITDHVAPGRSADARKPNDGELRQTTFVKVALDECSAKISEGFPEEPDEDLALDVWAGILPLRTVVGDAIS